MVRDKEPKLMGSFENEEETHCESEQKGDGFSQFKNKYSYDNPSLYSKYFN